MPFYLKLRYLVNGEDELNVSELANCVNEESI